MALLTLEPLVKAWINLSVPSASNQSLRYEIPPDSTVFQQAPRQATPSEILQVPPRLPVEPHLLRHAVPRRPPESQAALPQARLSLIPNSSLEAEHQQEHRRNTAAHLPQCSVVSRMHKVQDVLVEILVKHRVPLVGFRQGPPPSLALPLNHKQ